MIASLFSPAAFGLAAVTVAIAVLTFLELAPARHHLPRERRRPDQASGPGLLNRTATALTEAIDALLRRRGTTGAGQLERAGVRMGLQDYVFLVVVATIVAFALGLILSGPVMGVFLALLAPALAACASAGATISATGSTNCWKFRRASLKSN